ncbi:MAG TPA: toxin-antitoxin system protein [Thermoanaerobaculia bacterium]|jgi:hypothetical protein
MSSAAAGSATVQISLGTRDQIRDLAAQIGKSMQTVVEEAIDLYRRQCFLKEVNAAYADLREDPQAWSEIAEERAEWDVTLLDGLPED